MAFAERFVEMPDDVLAEVLRNFDPLAPDFLLSLGAVCARGAETCVGMVDLPRLCF